MKRRRGSRGTALFYHSLFNITPQHPITTKPITITILAITTTTTTTTTTPICFTMIMLILTVGIGVGAGAKEHSVAPVPAYVPAAQNEHFVVPLLAA